MYSNVQNRAGKVSFMLTRVCILSEATFYISKKIKVIFSPSQIVDAFAQMPNHKAHTVKTPNWKNWHGSRPQLFSRQITL